MIRDLIDLANSNDTEACFIFLDQEKAFDRVNHDFLYKCMRTFGIGDNFIHWIKVIYSNASTRIKINGFLTENIQLKRGVRQGDPLSFLEYIFINEIMALQLRKNPNIVGFQVGGEKIVSLHYADDTTICILQNRCFKEVYKELLDYEKGTGAKINYDKTKALWVGKWRNRTDTPLPLKFTNGNIKSLGVYFGNDNPAMQTFQEIIPKIAKSLNYWKQFKLCKLTKARVMEIFHLSTLWYASNIYPIPQQIVKQLETKMSSFLFFPQKNATIALEELKKLRLNGGAKLIDISSKSRCSKVKWLMELCINPDLNVT